MLLSKIKELCKEKQMSLAQLEIEANLSKNSIYRWSESIPAADKLAAVAKILGTTTEDLLGS